MNDDKYIGIENLSHTVNSMTALLDDRNALLNSIESSPNSIIASSLSLSSNPVLNDLTLSTTIKITGFSILQTNLLK